ncbi:hypothetical protein H6G06_22960 [Anabaena sphaerica FACHB-251]|uniref:Uncharacterized protein n=1 Tax=Anabaena sphaerica FACHB-251 TaxID=2692883 RepID=A0A926WMR8_9NOST|nr:hypothetical protein [Anabaena sphaerica]MBD2296261.1 hypothetical protein [Anabaena sphaerica FACHB-251]
MSQIYNLKIGIVITAPSAGKSDNLHTIENRYQSGNGYFVLSEEEVIGDR